MVASFGVRVIVRADDTALVRVHGELDAFTTAPFRDALEEASAHAKVAVDLEQVRFISAAAIGALIGCTTRATNERFAVAATAESWVRRIMTLCDYPYPIAMSLDDALRSLGAQYRRFPRAGGSERDVGRGRRGAGVRPANLR